MRFSTFLCATALPFAVASASGHADNHAKRHHELKERKNVQTFNLTQPLNLTERALEKRGTFTNARFTFYDVGLGACGNTNVPSDYIVALNRPQYGGGYPGPNCFRPIHITYNGKSADAVIMDECEKCPYGALDFSRGLFDHFASEDQGTIYGSWWFTDEGDGGDDTTTTSKAPTPKTTSHTSTTHTTTSSTPTPTSTSTHTSTTPTSTSTSTVVSTASIDVSAGVASGLAQTTGAEVPSQTVTNALDALSDSIVYMGALVVAGAQVAN